MRSTIVPSLAALLGLISTVKAHYTFPTFILPDGTVDGPFTYVRPHINDQEPLFDPESTDLICNIGGVTSGPEAKVAQVSPGDTIGFVFSVRIFHIGPLLIYMSRAPDGNVQSYDGSGDWFKVHEVPPVPNAQTGIIDREGWPAIKFERYSFKIPESTPPGQYLVRMEHLAVHYAMEPRGTQYYVSCAQIEVTGSGAGEPGPLVKIPGLYSDTDPGILFDPYVNFTSYTMPGPAVWQA